MRTHRFAGRRRPVSRGAALILAFGPPLAVLEACLDGDSSKTPESRALHAEKGGQPGKGQSEGGDSSVESESPPGGTASNGKQSADKGDGTTASDEPSGGVLATPSGSSAGGGLTPGGGKAAGTGTPSLNPPMKMKGWKVDQANSGKILSKSKKGCFLSAGRQQVEGAQGSKRKMTKGVVNRHLAELQQGKSNFHAEPSGRTKLRGANGVEVDGIANAATYVDAGGKSYRGWYQLRAFSMSTPAAYVLVSYMYPTSAYSESELTRVIEKSGLSVDGDVPGGIVNRGGAASEAAPPRVSRRSVRRLAGGPLRGRPTSDRRPARIGLGVGDADESAVFVSRPRAGKLEWNRLNPSGVVPHRYSLL